MLALKSYEQSNGFSVMDADELLFINGGSSTTKTSETHTDIKYEDKNRTVQVVKDTKKSETTTSN